MMKNLLKAAKATSRRAGAITQRLASPQAQVLQQLDAVKMLQGKLLIDACRRKASDRLQDYEFKVFSQWGEDGIIQALVDAVAIEHKTFIEFGVEDFSESNCRFLMSNDNWSGFVIDGSERNVERLKSSYFYWMYQLTARASFITRENINELLSESAFGHDVGLMSVDIDGVDYFVLEAISYCAPRILIVEYNAVFGPERKITVPYDPAFFRTAAHHSNLYFGASLAAFTDLARAKGYVFVGTNSNGINAFFVRSDLVTDRILGFVRTAGFTPSKTRESRNESGQLSFVSGDARLAMLAGMPVMNTATGDIETL